MDTFLQRNRGAIYVLLLMLTLGGVYALVVRAPRPEPIEIVTPTEPPVVQATPEPSPEPLLVHVVGEVLRPGVYKLAGDARVVDAVNAAGGLTANADTEMINLADRVSDGQQVRVPGVGAAPQPSLTPFPVVASQRSGAGIQPVPGLVNINTATASELEALPGIGSVLASRIVAYRTEQGPFQTIEQIMDVSGIGESYFAQMRALITVQ